MFKTIKIAYQLSNPAKIRLNLRYCPICEATKPIVRLDNNEIAIRCCSCKASVVSMSMASVIMSEYPDLQSINAYELSARGVLVGFLKEKCKELTTSEFYPDQKPGILHNGVLCQDVQNLTFQSNRFDLVTSTDVFEHVPNDYLGLANVYRVLKPEGKVIFTVPLWGDITVQRARVDGNREIEHVLAPEYHGDPISKTGKILAFRNYGHDIVSLLEKVGFKSAGIVSADLPDYWGIRRDVVVAQK